MTLVMTWRARLRCACALFVKRWLCAQPGEARHGRCARSGTPRRSGRQAPLGMGCDRLSQLIGTTSMQAAAASSSAAATSCDSVTTEKPRRRSSGSTTVRASNVARRALQPSCRTSTPPGAAERSSSAEMSRALRLRGSHLQQRMHSKASED